MRPNRFQQETIINAANRLTARDSSHKYLISDEVGLGKTVTAGGIIRRLYEMKKAENPAPIRVGYICANMALAEQNQSKLQSAICFDEEGSARTNGEIGRISLAYYNTLISKSRKSAKIGANAKAVITLLTPETTIKITSPGTKEERALAAGLLFGTPNQAISLSSGDKGSLFLMYNGRKGNAGEDILADAKAAIGRIPQGDFEGFRGEFLGSFEDIFNSYIGNHANLKRILDSLREVYQVSAETEIAAEYIFFCAIGEKFSKTSNADPEEHFFGRRTTAPFLEEFKRFFERYNKDPNCKTPEDFAALCFSSFLNKHPEFSVSGKSPKEQAVSFYDNCLQPELDSHKGEKSANNKFHRVYLPLAERIMEGSFISSEITDYLNNKLANVGSDKYSKALYAALLSCDKALSSAPAISRHPNLVEATSASFDKVFCEVGKKLYGIARESLIITTLNKIPVDIFVADEIQNYSEIFDSGKYYQGLSELDYVVRHIIHQTDSLSRGETDSRKMHDILLLSATPFRVHTKIGEQGENDSDEVMDEGSVRSEFELITGYLAPNGKDFAEKWNAILAEKKAALKDKSPSGFSALARRQSDMLRSLNLSRVERFIGKTGENALSENTTDLSKDEVSFEELLRQPNFCEYQTVTAQTVVEELNAGVNYFLFTGAEDGFLFRTESGLDCINMVRAEGLLDRLNLERVDGELFMEDVPLEEPIYWLVYDNGNITPTYIPDEETAEELCAVCENILTDKKYRISYLKTTPAMLSFSSGYASAEGFNKDNMLTAAELNEYRLLFGQNARLRSARLEKLFRKIFDEEKQHLLLFIPPSRPPKRGLGGWFKGMEGKGISKRLFFSEYNMVPDSLSALISYEANRRVCELLPKEDFDILIDKDEALEFDGKPLTVRTMKSPSFGANCSSRTARFKEDYARRLFEQDKALFEEHSNGKLDPETAERYENASPYLWSKTRIPSFCEPFCLSIYNYMLRSDCLRVLTACFDDREMPLFEKILRYFFDGGVHEVFDEFFFACRDMFAEFSRGEGKSSLSILSAQHHVNAKVYGSSTAEKMLCDFAIGNNLPKVSEKSDAVKLKTKIDLFNTPFRPFCFISTTIGQEGFDFHLYCRRVVHWSLEYNPIKFEQREGRVNRYHSHAIRLNAAHKANADAAGWEELFKSLCSKKEINRTHGLYPDFILEGPFGVERETYFFPFSAEKKNIRRVLEAVGYYRSLLGQFGDDQFEEEFRELWERADSDPEFDKRGFFINLCPTFETVAENLYYRDANNHLSIAIRECRTEADRAALTLQILPNPSLLPKICGEIKLRAFEDSAVLVSPEKITGLKNITLEYRLSPSWSGLELDFSVGGDEAIHFLFTKTGVILRTL